MHIILKRLYREKNYFKIISQIKVLHQNKSYYFCRIKSHKIKSPLIMYIITIAASVP